VIGLEIIWGCPGRSIHGTRFERLSTEYWVVMTGSTMENLMVTVRKTRALGPLHELLLEACPPTLQGEDGVLRPDPNGIKSISRLARMLDMTDQGVRLWITKGIIPGKRAKAITDLPGCSVPLEKFSPYIQDWLIAPAVIPD
jgi:hypothetical protein